SFDGENRAGTDDHRLPGVDPRGFLGNAEAERGILELALLHHWTADVSGRREKILKERRGGQKDDAVLGEFLGDAAEERLGVTLLESREEHQSAEIGAEIEEIFRCNL